MATGMPKITDWGLVVTLSQLMVPLSEHDQGDLVEVGDGQVDGHARARRR